MKKNKEQRQEAAAARLAAREGKTISLTGMRQQIKAGKLTVEDARKRLTGTKLDSPEFIHWLVNAGSVRYAKAKEEFKELVLETVEDSKEILKGLE